MAHENQKILIVDDEPDIIAFFQSFLEKRGFRVSTTGSGREALEMTMTFKPDLIFLDLTLKELSGQEVLRSLRAFDKGVKVVIITGQLFKSDKDREELLSWGVDACLKKPISLKDIEKTVYALLGVMDASKAVQVSNLTTGPGEPETTISHSLANLLGIIRNKCENFTLDIEDNIYKDKKDKELVVMAVRIMEDVIAVVDRAMKVVDRL